MLLHPYWLSSLLFTASATASVALRPRQNGTAATSAAPALPVSSAIYLVVGNTGTPFDGSYLTVGQAFPEDELDFLLFGDTLPDPSGASVFTVDDVNGTLTQVLSSLIATYIDPAGPIIMAEPDSFADIGLAAAHCGIARMVGCQTTGQEATLFYGSVSTLVAGGYTTPHVELGPYVPPEEGAVELIVLPIPV